MNYQHIYQKVQIGIVILILSMLEGCGMMHFQNPTANSTVSSPIAINVSWNANMEPSSSPEIIVDGVNVYAQPLFANAGSNAVSGSVNVCSGAHTLEAWGHLYCWYCVGNKYPRVGTSMQVTTNNGSGASVDIQPNPINVNAGTAMQGYITLSAASMSPVSFTLTPPANARINNALAGQATTVTVSAGQTRANFNVTGIEAGSGDLGVGGAGYCSDKTVVNVRPVVSNLSPTSGVPRSNLAITGVGFVQGASVNFGQTAATTQYVSSTQLTSVVPANATGTPMVSVLNAGQTSNALAFTVLAAPPLSPSPAVFRTSERDVQSFDFSTPSNASLINAQSATLSPGMLVVGLAYNGAGVLVRSSSQDVQTFNVNPAGLLSSGGAVSATLSPVGAAVLALSGSVIRASATDLQVFNLVGSNLTLQGSTGASFSSTGTGIGHTLLGGRGLAVRGYDSGIEVFDITQPTAITARGNNNNQAGLSSVGVGVRVIGTRAIRVYSGGLEVYDLTPATPNRIAANMTGGLSATGVATDADAMLNRIIRATDSGIEVYQLSGTMLNKLGEKRGALSPTGVAVALSGNRVFRAYSGGVEEYDISTPANIPAPTSVSATLSSTGIGIAIRP